MTIEIGKRFWERGRERGRRGSMGHMGYMGTPLLIAPMFCARRHISTTVRIYSIFNHLDNIFKSMTHITHCPMKRGARQQTHVDTLLGATYLREGYLQRVLSRAPMGHAKSA